ncbi:MAG: LuxR C-terminal-related transcriptional regulator [Ilumatobacteraceae bacterium]
MILRHCGCTERRGQLGHVSQQFERCVPPSGRDPPASRRLDPRRSRRSEVGSPGGERSVEVVALVAEGSDNPQIAERLFVSRATVKTHLSHVYTEVGIANRAELASLATRRQRSDDAR